jgi:rare lipoprotein A
MKNILLAFLVTQGWTTICAQSADSIRKHNASVEVPRVETGIASYYHSKFQGRPTASGEKYDENKMTAAHNRLPMGTMVRVTNLRNKRSVVVRINDRLHHRNTRLIDLSRAAALKLGYVARGLAKVKVEVLKDQ